MKTITPLRYSAIGLILFLLVACNARKKQTHSTQSSYVKLELENLICKKRAEKLAGIGSVNDEVLLLIYHSRNPNSHQLLWQFPIFQFANEEDQVELAMSLTLGNEESNLKVVLIEIDTERNSDEIISIITNALNAHTSSEKIKTLLGDDDLLGIKSIDSNVKKRSQSPSFWGIHLFDEYSYEVEYSLN